MVTFCPLCFGLLVFSFFLFNFLERLKDESSPITTTGEQQLMKVGELNRLEVPRMGRQVILDRRTKNKTK